MIEGKTVIVGAGIAGLTAAAYIARDGRDVAVFEQQEKTGGLVHSFRHNGFLYDAGLRSIENSGIVYPMLRQLGIDIDFIHSRVSLGLEDRVITLDNEESLGRYQEFLESFFPENRHEVGLIVKEISRIMKYMDVLYGIDNPAFLDLKGDPKYLFTVILPWLLKYTFTIGKIDRLNKPVEEHLGTLTKNQALIDIIAQHFFKKTPTFFALSYFKLYLDYSYPRGGTGVIAEKMEDLVRRQGGEIHLSSPITAIWPEEKYILTSDGSRFDYDSLIWTADLKRLYNAIDVEGLKDPSLADTVRRRRAELADLTGGDSVFTLYLSVDKPKEYFSRICSEHFFYTPSTAGLSRVDAAGLDEALLSGDNERVRKYLADLCALNTYEISIPVLRDPALAPEGKTGLEISLLFDYSLTKAIHDSGGYEDFKVYMAEQIINVLDANIFPGLKDSVIEGFSSSPLTIAEKTGNSDGAITGWAFTNPHIPVTHRMKKIFSSPDTPVPGIWQAGQWSYSPSGLPISVLTGKLAADRVLKARG